MGAVGLMLIVLRVDRRNSCFDNVRDHRPVWSECG